MPNGAATVEGGSAHHASSTGARFTVSLRVVDFTYCSRRGASPPSATSPRHAAFGVTNGIMDDRAPATGAEPFRVCGACRERWPDAMALLTDAALSLVGLQVAEHLPDANLIVFEHACGSSVSVRTSRLRCLLPDPEEGADWDDRYGTEECRKLCRQLDEWAACDRRCIKARDRELLQLLIRIKAGPLD